MKLWLVSRTDQIGYDQYDSAVVAAETEDVARHTYPGDSYFWNDKLQGWATYWNRETLSECYDWAKPDTLTVEYLGTTDRKISGVILASFNAG